MKTIHAPFLVKQHQEKENSELSIRRYCFSLFNFMEGWSIVKRRSLCKIVETAKLANHEKYALAFHPSQLYPDLQEMNGIKDHVNSVGGCWGANSWACLVRDDVDIDFESSIDSGLDNTQSKRALLIPIRVFKSSQIMKFCNYLGQNDDY